MALTRDKRNLFMMVGGLLAVMALFQLVSYDLLIPSQDLQDKHGLQHARRRPSFMVNSIRRRRPARCESAFCTFMDVTIDSSLAGQIVFLLDYKKRPKTAENFRALCTGEKGVSFKGTTLHYKGTTFSRGLHNILVKGGDIHNGEIHEEEEEESVYGNAFDLESHDDVLHERGLVAMAGRVKIGSKFFITLDSSPELDRQYVVFGEVVEGMNVVDKINSIEMSEKGEPIVPILIANSGAL